MTSVMWAFLERVEEGGIVVLQGGLEVVDGEEVLVDGRRALTLDDPVNVLLPSAYLFGVFEPDLPREQAEGVLAAAIAEVKG